MPDPSHVNALRMLLACTRADFGSISDVLDELDARDARAVALQLAVRLAGALHEVGKAIGDVDYASRHAEKALLDTLDRA